ncbi:MAG: NAD(P)/FAD-dependent oxidoreductase [Gammaproteobacteria bacterium]|nr:NAD(P)/FAD-dependent oxidoreductase [Gammaproteobacteria bacterium]
MANTGQLDAIIVGAGIAGLYMLHRLRQAGLSVLVLERGKGVGGTWYWNRYPGARCDVESLEYSYSFSERLQQEWNWSERYSGQPEILDYINHVANRFDLLSGIQFGTKVEKARYDETHACWIINTDQGDRITSKFLIMATGCLSSANIPQIEGRESFKGATYHTGSWPHHEIDFSGQRVGVIGTGSSAIQAIPHIAAECESLTVFQRTANYSVPARNGTINKTYEAEVKANYAEFRKRNRMMPAALGSTFTGSNQSALEASPEEQQMEFAKRWNIGGFGFLGAYNDLTINKESNDVAAEFVRERIRETVADANTAGLLCPDSVIGCKRLCLDTNYFETYNMPHVHLVDIREDPIQRIMPTGIRCKNTVYELDDIVFATGFDAMTGTLLRIRITGRSGLTLQDAWKAGPRTYLGLTVKGFPNMFLISGPGSPSVLTNMIVSIEQHVEWIERCVSYILEKQYSAIEAEQGSQDGWVEHVNLIASKTLYPSCNSWYRGANIPGKPRVFMPHIGFPTYVAQCEEVESAGYSGFEFY